MKRIGVIFIMAIMLLGVLAMADSVAAKGGGGGGAAAAGARGGSFSAAKATSSSSSGAKATVTTTRTVSSNGKAVTVTSGGKAVTYSAKSNVNRNNWFWFVPIIGMDEDDYTKNGVTEQDEADAGVALLVFIVAIIVLISAVFYLVFIR